MDGNNLVAESLEYSAEPFDPLSLGHLPINIISDQGKRP